MVVWSRELESCMASWKQDGACPTGSGFDGIGQLQIHVWIALLNERRPIHLLLLRDSWVVPAAPSATPNENITAFATCCWVGRITRFDRHCIFFVLLLARTRPGFDLSSAARIQKPMVPAEICVFSWDVHHLRTVVNCWCGQQKRLFDDDDENWQHCRLPVWYEWANVMN